MQGRAPAAELGEAGQGSKVVSVCNGDLRSTEAFKGGHHRGKDGGGLEDGGDGRVESGSDGGQFG